MNRQECRRQPAERPGTPQEAGPASTQEPNASEILPFLCFRTKIKSERYRRVGRRTPAAPQGAGKSSGKTNPSLYVSLSLSPVVEADQGGESVDRLSKGASQHIHRLRNQVPLR